MGLTRGDVDGLASGFQSIQCTVCKSPLQGVGQTAEVFTPSGCVPQGARSHHQLGLAPCHQPQHHHHATPSPSPRPAHSTSSTALFDRSGNTLVWCCEVGHVCTWNQSVEIIKKLVTLRVFSCFFRVPVPASSSHPSAFLHDGLVCVC